MANNKEEKTEESNSEKKKKNVKQKVTEHLNKEVKFPVWIVGVIIILILTFLPVLPYTFTEKYTVNETTMVDVTKIVPDTTKPIDERICGDAPAKVTISTEQNYIRPYGKGFLCIGSFKVTNEDKGLGKWTYDYTFNISGKLVPMEAQQLEISPYSTVTFDFESNNCTNADTVSGTYNLINGPTVQSCRYEKSYQNMTVVTQEPRTVEKELTRSIQKSQNFWQMLFGVNKQN